MAMFPCDIHGARYRGPASAAYPAVMLGADARRRKVRSCAPCLVERVDNPIVPLQEVVFGAKPEKPSKTPPACAAHPKIEQVGMFFLTLYIRGEEERQLYAPVCSDCAAALITDWDLS